MRSPVITLLTDFGTSDHYVAAMKGVMLGICPDARLIDISHEVSPYAIAEAAFTLAQAWTFFPEETTHLVVVDPGVGSSRRLLAVRAAGHCFIAPDNGVLTMIYDAAPAHEVRVISAAQYFRQPVSQTFHGRDIFAPMAAHLAAGLPFAECGSRITDYRRLPLSRAVQNEPGIWSGTILKIDRFGNIITSFASGDWAMLATRSFRMQIGAKFVSRLAANYEEMAGGELHLIHGSAGFLEVSMRSGSAAAGARVQAGDTVTLTLL